MTSRGQPCGEVVARQTHRPGNRKVSMPGNSSTGQPAYELLRDVLIGNDEQTSSAYSSSGKPTKSMLRDELAFGQPNAGPLRNDLDALGNQRNSGVARLAQFSGDRRLSRSAETNSSIGKPNGGGVARRIHRTGRPPGECVAGRHDARVTVAVPPQTTSPRRQLRV